MKNFFKTFLTLLLLVLATGPLAQTAWQPYGSSDQGYLPKMIITWGENCPRPSGAPVGKKITQDSDAYALCDSYTTAEERWCNIGPIDFTCCVNGDDGDGQIHANSIKNKLKDLCKQHYNAVKAKMTNECDYIKAHVVGIDLQAWTFGSNAGDAHTQLTEVFFDANNGAPLPPYTETSEEATVSCDGGGIGPRTVCTNNIKGIKFELNRSEAGCLAHDYSDENKKCPECYEDRGDHNDSSFDSNGGPSNEDRDPLIASASDAQEAGGYIFSQGCKPQEASQVISSIGDDDPSAGIDIGSVFELTQDMNITNLINIFAPTCLLISQDEGAKYQKFEGWGTDDAEECDAGSPQCNNVYKSIDSMYNRIVEAGDNRRNPYKGNCGRGKFFYKTLPPLDSNNNLPVDRSIVTDNPDFNTIKVGDADASDDNDIWYSRTGCYNPEERFVWWPAGEVKEDIKYYLPNRRVVQPKDLDPLIWTGLAAGSIVSGSSGGSGGGTNSLLSTYADNYADMLVRLNNPANLISDDTYDPWDEPKPNQINTEVDASYLVPNDRLLMRHPMCVQQYNSGFQNLNIGAVSDLGAKARAMENVKLSSSDQRRIYELGSLPVCLANDSLSEVDSFCAHYFESANELTDIGGVQIPVSLHANYSGKNRYVFDYENFCWTNKDLNTHILAFDPYEHWLPPALKLHPDEVAQLTNPPAREDIYGNLHSYRATDFRRNHLTEYSARVVQDAGNPDALQQNQFYHELYSLEEYGYRDIPMPKKDYTFNPYKIYRPDGPNVTLQEYMKRENSGRKAKMQQCLKLYLEQWAFEGDKGAIVLDTYNKYNRIVNSQITPDASMCQWVAYYDTSDNYGGEEFFDFGDIDTGNFQNINLGSERNIFKAVMYYYFSQVQEKNNQYRESLQGDHDDLQYGFVWVPGIDYENAPLHLPPPLLTTFTSWQAPGSLPGFDPERLQSKTRRGNYIGDVPPLGIMSQLAKDHLGAMNDHGFRRRRGMRPEIFDYYNFLSFSALGVMDEGLDLTNGTQVGDGNAFGGDIGAVVEGATSALNAMNNSSSGGGNSKFEKVMSQNLYTPKVNAQLTTEDMGEFFSDLTKNLGWQINMERRNCNTVVPPHFWRDTIQPFKAGITKGASVGFENGVNKPGECDFARGSEVMNNLNVVLSETPIGSVVAALMEPLLSQADITAFLKGQKHWLTTNIDAPLISLITIVPTLPTMAWGFNYDNNYFYAKSGWSKYEIPGSDEKMPLMLEDNWMGRAGGKATMKTSIAGEPWEGNWFGNELAQDGGSDGIPDDDDPLQELYLRYQENYIQSWKELPRKVDKDTRLGTMIIDEDDFDTGSVPSSREWVEHIWPGDNCMHMLNNEASKDLVTFIFGDPLTEKESVIYRLADVDASITAVQNPASTEQVITKNGRRYIKYVDNVEQHQYIRDAWRVRDDIDLGEIPLFFSETSGSPLADKYKDNKQMGGFDVFYGQLSRYFEWMPHAWSIGIGLNKAFWCEFELPYNPFFTGEDNYKFNKTPITSHFTINAVDFEVSVLTGGDIDEFKYKPAKIPNNAKPKLEYYRVERIRDACGPFGVRSTWVDDHDNIIGKWLLGTADERYTRSLNVLGTTLNTTNMDGDAKSRSRCSGWLDLYKRGVTDPKIISWRLPRFDYEFLKSFLECTGPVVQAKSPCKVNEPALKLNKDNATCQAAMAAANIVACILLDVFESYTGGCDEYDAIQCYMSGDAFDDGGAGIDLGGIVGDEGGNDPSSTSDCQRKNCKMDDGEGEKWEMMDKGIDDALRALDYASRGDTFYGMEEQIDGEEEGDDSGGGNGGGTGSGGNASGGNGGGSGGGGSSGAVATSSSNDSLCDATRNTLNNLKTYASNAGGQCSGFTSAASSVDTILANNASAINSLTSYGYDVQQAWSSSAGNVNTLCNDNRFYNPGVENTAFEQLAATSSVLYTIRNGVQPHLSAMDTFNGPYTSLSSTFTVFGQTINGNFPEPPKQELIGYYNNMDPNIDGTTVSSIKQLTNDAFAMQQTMNSWLNTINNKCANDPITNQNDISVLQNIASQFMNNLTSWQNKLNQLNTYLDQATNICNALPTNSQVIPNNADDGIAAIDRECDPNSASSGGAIYQSSGGDAGSAGSVGNVYSSSGGWGQGTINGQSSGGGGGDDEEDMYKYRDPKYALQGVNDYFTSQRHSTQINKFWLRPYDDPLSEDLMSEDKPFGFWCSCPEDDSVTTRCREDLCTTEQHVLMVGRDVDGAVKIASKVGLDLTWLEELLTPVAVTKAPGPFGRWLQCYYQARAKSCPILTREVSDTPSYSTLVDPFPRDKVIVPGMSEASRAGQNFNVCDASKPSGVGDEAMDQFLRWSKEEPNHLARLPVWFESAGAGYKHQDMVFYTQTRDFDAPFMELAVPFPIDLITRDCQINLGAPMDVTDADGNTVTIPTGGCTNVFRPKDNDQIFTNLLGEINQREGTYEINYYNRASAVGNPDNLTPITPANSKDEYFARQVYKEGFITPKNFLIKRDTSKIEPDYTRDSLAYINLYEKYLKGLYATAVSYRHLDKIASPGEPGGKLFNVPNQESLGLQDDPDYIIDGTGDETLKTFYEDETKRQVSPRAQEAIVGPRGCDIGGWYEMMLYQARCIRWFSLNCICDYDKTFARGNSMNFALRSAGMEMTVSYPIAEGAEYMTNIPKDKRGNVITRIEPNQQKDVTGKVKPYLSRVKENVQNFIGNVFDDEETAENLVTQALPLDIKGYPMLASYGNITAKNDQKEIYPLAPRGEVGPEFAINSPAFKAKGLSKVMIGDIIYWDETIIDYFNGNPVDAGYPRHMAIVTHVERADTGTASGDYSGNTMPDVANPPIYIEVAEMNWGKNLDSCGNTDMWGQTSKRKIWNPNIDPKFANTIDAATNAASRTILIGNVPYTALDAGKPPIKKYASCQNADWAVCVEKYWDQVNIYRPYKLDISETDGIYQGYEIITDPQYNNAACQALNSTSFPELLTIEKRLRSAEETGILNDMGVTIANASINEVKNFLITKIESEGHSDNSPYNINRVFYESKMWHVLAEDPSSFARDELRTFLADPLMGSLDRCDPPVELRSNFKDVLRDTLWAFGLKTKAAPNIGGGSGTGGGNMSSGGGTGSSSSSSGGVPSNECWDAFGNPILCPLGP